MFYLRRFSTLIDICRSLGGLLHFFSFKHYFTTCHLRRNIFKKSQFETSGKAGIIEHFINRTQNHFREKNITLPKTRSRKTDPLSDSPFPAIYSAISRITSASQLPSITDNVMFKTLTKENCRIRRRCTC